MRGRVVGAEGAALVAALMLTSFLAALGLGLAFTVSVDRMTDANHADQARDLYAAEGALELAAAQLGTFGDFGVVLEGLGASDWTDGSPGVRALFGGGTIDLDALTHQLSCGRTTACSDGQVATATAERPWGANNPRWRPFLHVPFAAIVGAHGGPGYVVVWIGDDAGEADGDPLGDGGDETAVGRGILRARAEAFGRLGARRAVEAELVRICHDGGGADCLPGMRVQFWREVQDRLP